MSAPTTTYTRPTEIKTANRESWLQKAADLLIGRVLEAGGEKPAKLRVSCGWPSKRALPTASSASRTLGQAWYSEASEDAAREVFISPALAEECRVMDVLLHELIHACLPSDAGHGPAFQSIMRQVGLAGKPTATVASDELLDELKVLAHELGRYPHEKLDMEPGPRKPGRMVKGYCPDCETILYGSRASWDNALPTCGNCGTPYVVEPTPAQAIAWGLREDTPTERLVNVTAYAELKTTDGRFTLRTTKRGSVEGSWTVTDHQAIEVGRRMVEQLDSEDQLVEVEVVEYDERWTSRRDRADALAFVAAIREGEITWGDVEVEDEPEAEVDLDDEDVWGELGDWGDGSDDFLDEDEDEVPDYPEDMPLADGEVDLESLSTAERAKLFTTQPATESEFAAVEKARDESGARKSAAIIAAGGEGAMD